MAQPTISIGSTGEAVTYLRESLVKLSYNPGPIEGIFGPNTEITVKLFQKDKALVVDGIVGNNTWLSIEKALAALFTISDYFPVKENTKYVYEGKGNDYATYSIFIDYLIGNRSQLRHHDSGIDLVRVLENKDGKLTMLLSREADYRENFMIMPSVDEEILLKEPLVKGTTWIVTGNRKRYISNVEAEVITPMGKYIALEVTTEDKDSKNFDYYALNVGLVKTLFISSGKEISSTLSKIEDNSLFTQTVEFYYPNIDEHNINYVYKKLSFKTNDVTRVIIETAYKEVPPGDIFRVLGPNAKINSVYLNKDGLAYVDFSKEFITELNTGSGYEVQVLQCVTNTFGRYYSVIEIFFTVEDKPYASGHVLFEQGEIFIVDLSTSSELK